MNNPFTVEETNLMCIFQSDSRTKANRGHYSYGNEALK